MKVCIHFVCFILLVFVTTACNDDDKFDPITESCFDIADLETVKTFADCNADDVVLLCDLVEVEGVEHLSDDDYNWAAMDRCNHFMGYTYTALDGDSSVMEITNLDAFVWHRKLYSICDQSSEHESVFCQKNEKLVLSFLLPELGLDTLTYEIFHNTYTDESGIATLPPPMLFVKLGQQKELDNNVATFSFQYTPDNFTENNQVEFHDMISINGVDYTNVVEFKLRENIASPPHTSFYIKQGLGFFAFRKINKFWVYNN